MDSYGILHHIQQVTPIDIDYPPVLRGRVLTAVESWMRFCALPQAVKQRFSYFEDDRGLGGSGYELKGTEGSAFDPKQNFHVSLTDINRFFQDPKCRRVVEGSEFINNAERLINFLTPTIIKFSEYLEEHLSLSGFKDEVMEGRRSWILRYIHYFGGCPVGYEIAAPHADKSGFTLHAYESEPGLEYLDQKKQWQPMPVSEGQTAIIPGMQLQFASENKAKAICHRVIATESSVRRGRYSVVCFIPLPNTKAYNKSGAGRMQEFTPGFNYDLPWPEFQKLFV